MSLCVVSLVGSVEATDEGGNTKQAAGRPTFLSKTYDATYKGEMTSVIGIKGPVTVTVKHLHGGSWMVVRIRLEGQVRMDDLHVFDKHGLTQEVFSSRGKSRKKVYEGQLLGNTLVYPTNVKQTPLMKMFGETDATTQWTFATDGSLASIVARGGKKIDENSRELWRIRLQTVEHEADESR